MHVTQTAAADITMQVESSIYDAASRAVQHQRNPDGSLKQTSPPEPGVGVTSQAAGHTFDNSCLIE